jgi:hypothetical protein
MELHPRPKFLPDIYAGNRVLRCDRAPEDAMLQISLWSHKAASVGRRARVCRLFAWEAKTFRSAVWWRLWN